MRTCLNFVCLTSLAITGACGSDDTSISDATVDSAVDTGASGDSGGLDSAAPDADTGAPADAGADGGGGDGALACLPDGVFGKCSDNPGCMCLRGATVYEFCTISCTEDSQCGSVADTPGAVPGCFPLNPGAAEMICALVCTEQSDCPCDLICMPSGVPGVNICADPQ